MVGGAGVVLGSFVRFVTEGHGTPAPPAAPDQLVVGGPNRWVRNPMYVAVVGTIVGEGLLLGRPILLADAVVTLAVMAAFVHWYEEPELRRRFGASYDAYRRSVPGWWPRSPRGRRGTGGSTVPGRALRHHDVRDRPDRGPRRPRP